MRIDHATKPLRTAIPRAIAKAQRIGHITRRLPTNSVRALPSFLIIGTQRGGTTGLHVHLGQHPQIVMPVRKEVQFFDRFYGMGPSWYRAHFPRATELLSLPGGGSTGEATANYLFDQRVPARVHSLIPNVKLIVLLRNPVERAHSAWKLMTRQGRETRSFASAVESELEDEARSTNAGWFRAPAPAYIARGQYEKQLRTWLGEFERARLLIIKSEYFFEHPHAAFSEVTGFLEIGAWQPEQFRPLYSTRATPMEPLIRASLAKHFEPQNRRLTELVGQDFDWE